MSDPALGPSGRPDVIWRLRWWLLGGGIAVVLSLVVLEVDVVERPLRWSLLVWGLVVGAVAALGVWVGATLLLRRPGLVGGREEWTRHRRTVFTLTWLLTGVVAGLVAGIIDAPLVLYVFAAYVVLIAAAIGVIVLLIRRRRTAAT